MPIGPFPTLVVSTTFGGDTSVLIRDTVPSRLLVTHTSVVTTTTPAGPCPTGIVVDVRDCSSTRDTVPSPLFATQIAPAPEAIASGLLPTIASVTIRPSLGSITPTLSARMAFNEALPPTLLMPRARAPAATAI